MFIIKVAGDYSKVIRPVNFKKRLEERVKISPEEFDRWMTIRELPDFTFYIHRELNYGKCPYVPQVRTIQMLQTLTHFREHSSIYMRVLSI